MEESSFEQRLYNERRDKLKAIAELGAKHGLSEAEATYPNSFPIAAPGWTEQDGPIVPWLKQKYDPPVAPVSAEDLAASHIDVSLAGRVMAIRLQGKAGFAHIQQGGQRLQIYVRKDDVGEDAFALYKLLDLGDHIGVRGFLMRTRTGELTIHAHPQGTAPALAFLAKAMLALPDKFHGLEDTELRYRQRYLDLIMNTGTLTKAEASSSTQTPVILSGAPSPREASATQQAVILSAARSAESKNPDALSPTETAQNPSATEPGAPRLASETWAASPQRPEDVTEIRNVREVFVKRAAVLRAIRKFFDARGYLEVETPMLHTIAGGAAARPFKTHHNALDMPLSLRIAPELFLKRLVVGGLDRVYEINRNFRNEGISTQHNPEFTMLEFYQAYSNYHDLMNLTQELVTFIATEVNGTTLTNFNGTEIDLSKWQKLSMREAIIKFWPPEVDSLPTTEIFTSFDSFSFFLATVIEPLITSAQALSGSHRVKELWALVVELKRAHDGFLAARALMSLYATEEESDAIQKQTLGKTIAAVFEAVAESQLTQPTIIYDFPLAVSPLSKIKPDEPEWVERFEFYIGGFEVGNAFSELNDPDDQRARFEAQLLEKERGDDEAHAMDEDYVRALGYGLPPTAGEGIGIDRLTMILTGSRSIRDVILFPLMRPQATTPKPE